MLDAKGYLNIRNAWGIHQKSEPPSSIPQMLERLGLKFEGRAHSGRDDFLNIAHFIIYCNSEGIELTDKNSVLDPPHNTDTELEVSLASPEHQDAQELIWDQKTDIEIEQHRIIVSYINILIIKIQYNFI